MYQILNKDSLPNYLAQLPKVMEVLGNATEFGIDEIGDGNLNFVFRVCNAADRSQSVIVKQAVPYLRMVGEEWPLSRERMTFEIRALKLYNELVSEFVPNIYHADEDMSVLIMQCLDEHIILRLGMIDAIKYPDLGAHIGEFLAGSLFKSSSFGMGSIPRRELVGKFVLNTELCKLTEDFIFTFPYMDHESNYCFGDTKEWAEKNIIKDSEYKLAVLELKDKFVNKSDALLHADLHTGSFMVRENETRVIDMEFAFFGPFGFDIGKIIANFLLCYTAHFAIGGGKEYQEWLLEEALNIWKVFAERFLALWNLESESLMLADGLLDSDEFKKYQARVMTGILQDSVGFAGCSLARRTLGIAGVADIRDIEPVAVRSRLEIVNLQLSKKLIKIQKEIQSIDELETVVRSFYSEITIEEPA